MMEGPIGNKVAGRLTSKSVDLLSDLEEQWGR